MAKPKNEQQKTEQENTANEVVNEEITQEETATEDTGEISDAKAPEATNAQGKPVPLRNIEEWATVLRIPTWQVAALKQYKKYAAGKTLSRAEFEAGLAAALNQPMRG